MSASEKLKNLEQFALEVGKAALKLDGISPMKAVHVQLPPGYWHDRVSDLMHDGRRDETWVSQMHGGSFEICGVTFHNNRQMPDWMK